MVIVLDYDRHRDPFSYVVSSALQAERLSDAFPSTRFYVSKPMPTFYGDYRCDVSRPYIGDRRPKPKAFKGSKAAKRKHRLARKAR